VSGVLENRIPIHFQQAIVVDFPPIFKTNRLGGLLSPQLLAANGRAAVLDLRKPSLKFKTFDSAFTKLRLMRSDTSEELDVCVNHDSQFVNRLYQVPVFVAGYRGGDAGGHWRYPHTSHCEISNWPEPGAEER